MSKLDLTKPIRRKSDGARAVVLDPSGNGVVAVNAPGLNFDDTIWQVFYGGLEHDLFYENVPERVTRFVLATVDEIDKFNWQKQAPSDNLKLTFEGDVLVDAEVLGGGK